MQSLPNSVCDSIILTEYSTIILLLHSRHQTCAATSELFFSFFSQIESKTLYRKNNTFTSCNALWTSIIFMVFLSTCSSDIVNDNSVKRDLTEHILNLTKLHKEAIDDISADSIKSYLE